MPNYLPILITSIGGALVIVGGFLAFLNQLESEKKNEILEREKTLLAEKTYNITKGTFDIILGKEPKPRLVISYPPQYILGNDGLVEFYLESSKNEVLDEVETRTYLFNPAGVPDAYVPDFTSFFRESDDVISKRNLTVRERMEDPIASFHSRSVGDCFVELHVRHRSNRFIYLVRFERLQREGKDHKEFVFIYEKVYRLNISTNQYEWIEYGTNSQIQNQGEQTTEAN